MKRAGYILGYLSFWILGHLPFRLQYFISDLFFVVVFHLFRYRRKVAFSNLRLAFPDKAEKEIRKIAVKFYHHLCDLGLETAISGFLSEKEINRRFSYKNPEVLENLYHSGKHVIGVGGHYGNWEWTYNMPLIFSHHILGIYKPMNNRWFDRYFIRTRERFGATTVPMEQVARELMEGKKNGRLSFAGLVADQRPIWEHIQYWTPFMGTMAPVYLGPEKLAVKLDMAVVFFRVRKIRRGFYETEMELITAEPASLPAHAITERHVRMLEDQIREEPAWWLWTHRRWKFSYEAYLQYQESKKQPA
ncbi:MAG: lysophospholipid acyltransferase family protein [Bacteroidota bacterium]